MAELRKHSSTSNLLRFTLKNSSTGQGLTGLSSASSGLIIATIADNEPTTTTYTVTAGNVETIATLGTFATPTASKCRFKEVDATNHPGMYEFQFANARFSVANARTLVVSVSGAANLLGADYEIQLTSFDPFDAAGLGLSTLDAAISTRATPTNITAGTITTVTNLTNAPTAGDLTATMKASVNAEVDTALADIRLDELLAADSDIDGAAPPTVGSVVHEMLSKTAGSFTYDQTTDSLEAIRDKETDIETDTAEIGAAGAGLTNINLPDQTMNVTGDVTGNLSGSVGSVTGGVIVTTNNDKTGYGLSAGERTSTADIILARALAAESYAADGAVPTLSQALYMLLSEVGEFSISGTTLTCKKLDGTTTSMTFTLDSATAPTSRTRAT